MLTGEQGVYAVYCCSVQPLWSRLFFYLVLQGHCLVVLLFTAPVVKMLYRTRNQVGRITSSRRPNSAHKALVRTVSFAALFSLAITAASTKRIAHSFQYDNYYVRAPVPPHPKSTPAKVTLCLLFSQETPDAGVVGLTEFVTLSMGLITFLIFGTTDATTRFYCRRCSLSPMGTDGTHTSALSSHSSGTAAE